MVKPHLQSPCVILTACLNAGPFEERFSKEEASRLAPPPAFPALGAGLQVCCLIGLPFAPEGLLAVPVGTDCSRP